MSDYKRSVDFLEDNFKLRISCDNRIEDEQSLDNVGHGVYSDTWNQTSCTKVENYREERFCQSSSDFEGSQPSDEDIINLLIAIQTFLNCLPYYLESMRKTLKLLIQQESHIRSSVMTQKVQWMQYTLDLYQSSEQECYDFKSECRKGAQILQIDLNKPEIIESIKRSTEILMDKINNNPPSDLKLSYPLVRYYTSQEGMKNWFKRSIPLSWYSIKTRRFLQFTEAKAAWKRQDLVDEVWRKNYVQEVDSVESAKKKIISIYQRSMHIITRYFLKHELEQLSLDNDIFHAHGVVYRGEKILLDELKEFQRKVDSNDQFLEKKLFCDCYCSTSQESSVAESFGSTTDGCKVLHVIHLVEPLIKEINEFQQLNPSYQIFRRALHIENLSVYPNEKEVLLWYPRVITLSSYEEQDSICYVESVAPSIRIQDTRSYKDRKNESHLAKLTWENYEQSNSSKDASTLRQFYKEYSMQKVRDYIASLNWVATYRFMIDYYTKKSMPASKDKLKILEAKLSKESRRLDLLKKINCDSCI